MAKPKFRFAGTADGGRTLLWESVRPIPGDSRSEQIRAPRAWFWRRTFEREAQLAFIAESSDAYPEEPS